MHWADAAAKVATNDIEIMRRNASALLWLPVCLRERKGRGCILKPGYNVRVSAAPAAAALQIINYISSEHPLLSVRVCYAPLTLPYPFFDICVCALKYAATTWNVNHCTKRSAFAVHGTCFVSLHTSPLSTHAEEEEAVCSWRTPLFLSFKVPAPVAV